ncbi:MAG: hypothetical protein ACRDNZ_12225 [Streptosporangiaceae bacterium]
MTLAVPGPVSGPASGAWRCAFPWLRLIGSASASQSVGRRGTVRPPAAGRAFENARRGSQELTRLDRPHRYLRPAG